MHNTRRNKVGFKSNNKVDISYVHNPTEEAEYHSQTFDVTRLHGYVTHRT